MSSSSEPSQTSRAYASFVPTWQRFNITEGGPSSCAGTTASTTTSSNGDGISPRSVATGGDAAAAAAAAAANASANPYLRQYSHVYSRRLAALRDRCLTNAKSDTSGATSKPAKLVSRILELEETVPSTIVGTVAKEFAPGRRPAVDTGYHSSAIHPRNGYLGTTSPSDLHLDIVAAAAAGGTEGLGTYCSPDAAAGGKGEDAADRVYLEDESGRVELVDDGSGVLDVHSLATGVVLAATGSVREGTGIMVVRGVYLPTLPDNDNASAAKANAEAGYGEAAAAAVRRGPSGDPDSDPYVLLISGLGCGASNAGTEEGDEAEAGGSLDLRRDLVLDYLAGHTDGARDGARVARVILAGGGCAGPAALADIAAATKANQGATFGASGGGGAGPAKGATGAVASPNDPSLPIKELDLFLSELCASGVPVDCVPGRHDPTTAVWPQRPLHPCLLPVSSTYDQMLRRAPNPYEAAVGGKVVLGTDGRNVADLRRYLATVREEDDKMDVDVDVDGEDDDNDDNDEKEQVSSVQQLDAPTTLEALEATLRFAHLAPTGPDSLPTYPAFEDDPFVMDVKPDLYFAGNCDGYATKVTEAGTRLVCVPTFDTTGQAVLVNLRTMDCEVIGFADASQ